MELEFLKQNFTFTLSGQILIFVILAVLLIFAILVTYIVRLQSKLKQSLTPRYGFLGKPAFPLFIVAILLTSIIVFNSNLPLQQQINIEAQKQLEVEISHRLIGAVSEGTNLVEFRAIPLVDKTIWGPSDQQFSFFWNIKGPVFIDQFEQNRSVSNPSGFQVELPPGNYTVKLMVVYEQESYEFINELKL